MVRMIQMPDTVGLGGAENKLKAHAPYFKAIGDMIETEPMTKQQRAELKKAYEYSLDGLLAVGKGRIEAESPWKDEEFRKDPAGFFYRSIIWENARERAKKLNEKE